MTTITVKRRSLKPLSPRETDELARRVLAAEQRKRRHHASDDADDPPWTNEQLAAARIRRLGGRPRRSPDGTQPVTLRIDRDILAWFRAQGPGYQGRINAILRAAVRPRRPATKV